MKIIPETLLVLSLPEFCLIPKIPFTPDSHQPNFKEEVLVLGKLTAEGTQVRYWLEKCCFEVHQNLSSSYFD
jgi:hypothetical protein